MPPVRGLMLIDLSETGPHKIQTLRWPQGFNAMSLKASEILRLTLRISDFTMADLRNIRGQPFDGGPPKPVSTGEPAHSLPHTVCETP